MVSVRKRAFFLEDEKLHLTKGQLGEMLPCDAHKVCLFATYERSCTVSPNRALYIKELARLFDVVIVETNADRLPSSSSSSNAVENLISPFPSNVFFAFYPNLFLDFGMHWRTLHNLKRNRIETLALVNDSCFLVDHLDGLFHRMEVECARADVVAPTGNSEVNFHLQSFFLVFHHPKGIDHLLRFVAEHPLHGPGPCSVKEDDKWSLIVQYEVGLSVDLRAKGCTLIALWTGDGLNAKRHHARGIPSPNPSYWMWDWLLEEGCPLLKRVRQQFPFGQQVLQRLLLDRPQWPLD